MKYILTLVAVVMMSAFTVPDNGSIHSFKVKSIEGGTIDFAKFKGKKILIVNTASKCGYTPQYEALQKVYDQYKDKLVIVGFPANNFGGQEPGTNTQIASFCQKNYGVTFQMFEKISVKGADQHELYQWLKDKTGKEPTWNFCKYLVKPDGTVKFFASGVNPIEIVDEI